MVCVCVLGGSISCHSEIMQSESARNALQVGDAVVVRNMKGIAILKGQVRKVRCPNIVRKKDKEYCPLSFDAEGKELREHQCTYCMHGVLIPSGQVAITPIGKIYFVVSAWY